MPDYIFLWVIFGLLGSFLIAKFKVAKDQERFAVITLGKYIGLKGPGILYKWSGKEVQWIRIACGDRGELISPNIVRINRADVPCMLDGNISLGYFVRVSGFDVDKLRVFLDPSQARIIVCEKCGHENKIS